MRTIITLVASIAILGASPAPADANWLKVVKAITKSSVEVVIDVIKKPVEFDITCWPRIAGHTLDDNATGDVSDEEVLQPTRDAAEDVGRKIDMAQEAHPHCLRELLVDHQARLLARYRGAHAGRQRDW